MKTIEYLTLAKKSLGPDDAAPTTRLPTRVAKPQLLSLYRSVEYALSSSRA